MPKTKNEFGEGRGRKRRSNEVPCGGGAAREAPEGQTEGNPLQSRILENGGAHALHSR